MKKYIFIILTTFLTSTVFFISNVSAKGNIIAPYYDFDNPENTTGTSKFTHLPTNATLPEEKKDNYNLALEYLANKCSSYDSYIISNKGLTAYGYDKQIELFCFNQSNNQITPSVSVTKSYYDGNNYYVYLNFYANVYKSSSVNYYYARFYDDKRVSENPKLDNNTVSIQFVSGDLASLNFGDFPILKSNIDFSFNNNYPTSTDSKVLLLSSFKLNGIIYNLGDFGYKNSELYDVNSKPSITILETSEEKTTVQDQEYLIAVNLNVESTNIDDSKYICMFSFDNKETWDKFNCSEKYSYKATNNGNYYAQIVSKENDSVISSTTYTITKIQTLPSSNPKIDIEITKKTNDQTDFISGGSCIINKNNNTYTQCEDINIKFSLIDESILKYEYSYDKQNWINFNFNILDKLDESNTISMRIYKNTTLYVRVINLDNNEINNSATYTITSINTTEFLTQEVTFQSVYYRDLMKIDVYSLFVNYDPTNYNYYFNTSADKNSFVDITNKIVCNANTSCRYITSFDYSGVVYIRIEDKQGNYINTFTYTVNYDHYLEKKNVNDYMNDVPKFMESMKGYISKFTDVLNYFFTSLNSTIKYAIITLFIVLIATCLIRMGKK